MGGKADHSRCLLSYVRGFSGETQKRLDKGLTGQADHRILGVCDRDRVQLPRSHCQPYNHSMVNVSQTISVEVLAMWQKVLLTCNNPLGLTEELVEKTLKTAPPKEYPGATFMGRYIIPRQFVRYDEAEQPRDKNNDSEHVNNLTNNFNTVGYREDAQPPHRLL